MNGLEMTISNLTKREARKLRRRIFEIMKNHGVTGKIIIIKGDGNNESENNF